MIPAVLLACQRMENVTVPAGRQFSAITEAAGDGTRTCMDGSLNVLWNGGDVLNVYIGKNKPVTGYAPADAEGKSETTISVREESSGGSGVIGIPVGEESIGFNVAYYPKVSGAINCQDSEYSIKVSVPDTQAYAENSFGRDAFHMVAVTLEGDPELKFTRSSGITPSTNTSITLDCGEGVALKDGEATSFFIALAPCVFQTGRCRRADLLPCHRFRDNPHESEPSGILLDKFAQRREQQLRLVRLFRHQQRQRPGLA